MSASSSPVSVVGHEVEFFQELGLGTGIDSTNPKMWESKAVLKQVRMISPNQQNIKKSQVNKMDYYSETVSTVQRHQVKFSGELRDPSMYTQLKIGVHAEQVRERDTEMKTVFMKRHTRSISFQDMEQIRHLHRALSTTQTTGEKSEQFRDNYFQTLLCLAVRMFCNLDINPTSDTIEDDIESYMKESEENFESVVKACNRFVAKEHITHYVSSIDLGAIHSAACSMQQFQDMNALGAKFGMGENGIVAKSKFEQMMSSSIARITKIGNPDGSMEDIRRKEAVIAFTIQPIYSLVSGRLQEALKKAVTSYVESRLKIPDNPLSTYNIQCMINSKPVFWKVNDENQIVGTTNPNEAHPFSVESTGSSVHKYEFHISYYKKGNGRMYLSCNGDMFGNHYGPLEVEEILDYKHAHFVLHSPLRHSVILWRNLQFPCTTLPCSYQPQHLKTWTHDGEPLMINCSRRRFKIDGYLAMEEYKEAKTSTADDCSYKLVAKGKVDTTSSTCAFQFFLIPKEEGISPSNKQQDVV